CSISTLEVEGSVVSEISGESEDPGMRNRPRLKKAAPKSLNDFDDFSPISSNFAIAESNNKSISGGKMSLEAESFKRSQENEELIQRLSRHQSLPSTAINAKETHGGHLFATIKKEDDVP